jgi:hypothetical protein
MSFFLFFSFAAKDNRVSESEYLLNAVYDKLMNSLMAEAAGEDGKLHKKEIVTWLSKELGITEDLELVASAVILGLKKVEETTEFDSWSE